MLLSVLDQVPERPGGGPGHAFADTLALARRADALGFHRYWVAEHHALGALACSAPEVLIGHIASATTHIRVGSGGVLLPNHRPIHVAEQFRLLEALHPARIDLGIGRSEGALDPAVVAAFGRDDDLAHGGGFATQLAHLLAFGGVRPLPQDDPLSSVRATPDDVPLPPVTLLGSSLSSARSAAELGLAYGFAAHTNSQEGHAALRAYREAFVPARDGDRPHAMLALKVVVGEDDAHAERLIAPWNLQMARVRAGIGGGLLPEEDALAHAWTDRERAGLEEVDLRADVVGSAETVQAGLREHAEGSGCDEVIAITIVPDPEDRRRSYERLAEVMELPAAA